jgi:hypothetical protein
MILLRQNVYIDLATKHYVSGNLSICESEYVMNCIDGRVMY